QKAITGASQVLHVARGLYIVAPRPAASPFLFGVEDEEQDEQDDAQDGRLICWACDYLGTDDTPRTLLFRRLKTEYYFGNKRIKARWVELVRDCDETADEVFAALHGKYAVESRSRTNPESTVTYDIASNIVEALANLGGEERAMPHEELVKIADTEGWLPSK